MTGLWKTWMTVWWWTMLAAAVVFLLAALPGLDGPVLAFYDVIHWPFDGQSGFAEATRPTAAILGAVFIGWMLTVRLVMDLAEKAEPAAAARLWRNLTGVMLVWYGVDSAASFVTGVPVNAVSNTAILATYLIPLLGSGVMAGAGAASPRSA